MTLHTRGWLLTASLLLTLATVSHHCAFATEQDEIDAINPVWKENDVALPAPPKKENLLPFYVSPTTTLSFAIDAKSVSVDKDGVVRYTLVATSNTGASNISYEGIRCLTNEKKLYAFGQADGSWTRARRGNWEGISKVGTNRQHAALAQDFFCDLNLVAGKAAPIVDRLRKSKPFN